MYMYIGIDHLSLDRFLRLRGVMSSDLFRFKLTLLPWARQLPRTGPRQNESTTRSACVL